MQPPPLPDDEPGRMAALRATRVLFTPSEERFDRVTRLAARLLDAPVALVTLVADDLQWFKSAQGLEATETSRADSFCGHAILEEETLVVNDAEKDPRFADNPLVTGAPHIRAYAGHPLHAPDGSRLGTLCVIDHKPRRFTAERLQILRDLAAIVDGELERGQLRGQAIEPDELARKAAIDPLTRLWNQSGVMTLLDAELARANRGAPTCVAIARASFPPGLVGTPSGDAVLVEIAARIRKGVRAFDVAGYCGGAEFLVVFSHCDLDTSAAICERIRTRVDFENIATPSGVVGASISIGLALCRGKANTALGIVAEANEALKRAEAAGGNRVERQQG